MSFIHCQKITETSRVPKNMNNLAFWKVSMLLVVHYRFLHMFLENGQLIKSVLIWSLGKILGLLARSQSYDLPVAIFFFLNMLLFSFFFSFAYSFSVLVFRVVLVLMVSCSFNVVP